VITHKFVVFQTSEVLARFCSEKALCLPEDSKEKTLPTLVASDLLQFTEGLSRRPGRLTETSAPKRMGVLPQHIWVNIRANGAWVSSVTFAPTGAKRIIETLVGTTPH